MDGYEVGRKVVCIDSFDSSKHDEFHAHHGFKVAKPVKGRVYTIRELAVAHTDSEYAGQLFLRFAELRNPILQYRNKKAEVCWIARKFKPLDEKRLDVFRSLLVPTKEKAIG